MGSGDITKELPNGQLGQILTELREIRAVVNGFGDHLASLDTKVASLETRVGSVETGMTDLQGLVEAKLLQAKPLWVAELTGKIDELNIKIDRGFRDLGRKIETLTLEIMQVRANEREFEERLSRLEH
jgi:prefoldin subunit 5